jgi:hypothetical protein
MGYTKARHTHHQKKAYAVTTRVPKHDSKIARLKLDLKKQHQATVEIKNLQATISL